MDFPFPLEIDIEAEVVEGENARRRKLRWKGLRSIIGSEKPYTERAESRSTGSTQDSAVPSSSVSRPGEPSVHVNDHGPDALSSPSLSGFASVTAVQDPHISASGAGEYNRQEVLLPCLTEAL